MGKGSRGEEGGRQHEQRDIPTNQGLEKNGDFFNPACREGHVSPVGSDGKEACIRFH